MYIELFKTITYAIRTLQEIQQTTEEMYIDAFDAEEVPEE